MYYIYLALSIILIFLNVLFRKRIHQFLKKLPLLAAFFVVILFIFIIPYVVIRGSICLDDSTLEDISIFATCIFIIGLFNSIFFLFSKIKKCVTELLEKKDTTISDLNILILAYGSSILLFTAVYLWLPFFIDNPFKGIASFGDLALINYLLAIVDCLYFSVVTITTVGYGDIYPIHWISKLVTTLEILTGLSIMTVVLGIVFILHNKDKEKEKIKN